MKKIFISMMILLMIFVPNSVNAAGYISTGTKSLTIEIGSSKTFTITAYNAVGDVAIVSDDTSIATVNKSFFETGVVGEGTTKKVTVTVKGISIGSTKIRLDVDGATFDGERLSDKDQVITVNVVEKKIDTRSTNNKLKSLSIEGHKIEKVNDNNYTLTVSNNVTSVKVLAVAEDGKAKIAGVGFYDLVVGVTNIKVVVTAENGSKNTINIKVTRRDGYYLGDLEGLLDSDNNNVDIILTEEKIEKNVIEKIKDSKKNVVLNYYDKNKKLIYSWVIDGSKIGTTMDVLTKIENVPSTDEIYDVVNYADGVYVSVLQEGSLPGGTKLRANVSDKYSDGEELNIYGYENGKMTKISGGVKVVSGYVEFTVSKGMDYFITKADLKTAVEVLKSDSGINLYLVISIVELFIILILVLFLMKKKKNNIVYSSKLDKLFTMEENVFPINVNHN